MLTYGKDVTMSSRTKSTEVLLRWKYVREAVGQALYTLESMTLLTLWPCVKTNLLRDIR